MKELAGNPGKRALNDREPKPEKRIPDCPDHLQGEASREWVRISEQLYRLGLLTAIDRAALAAYCQAWGRWVEAETRLRDEGVIVTASTGTPMQNPHLAVANKAMEQMQRLLVEFGMTPSSRSRIKVDTPQARDDLEAFLKLAQ